MKVHEYQAKEFFASYGIPVEEYVLCNNAEEAVGAYNQLGTGKVVVKAQVTTGGRGKAGGVRLATSIEEVWKHANEILGMNIKGHTVSKIIVSQAIQIESEYYVGLTIDRNTKSVMLMLSDAGGMDIEEVAKYSPEKIHKFEIDPLAAMTNFLARRYAFTLFKDMNKVDQLVIILQDLHRLFLDKDATLAEINPLVLTPEGRLIAVDAKMTFDDNALYRHPQLHTIIDMTEEEKTEAEAKEKGFSYVHMDGEIGCMVNGAGLAMATMDMIKLHGGKPANFLDIGGSSNPQKVVEAMKLLLKHPRLRVVFINIFGGITRCDDVAKGLLKAFDELKTNIPVIVRLTGTNEKEGREMLRNSQFKVAETMGDATQLAVQAAR